MVASTSSDPIRVADLAVRRLVEMSRAPRTRTIAEFAEQEIILPTGPFQGMRYRLDRQPYVRLLFQEMQNPRWRRIVVTGPSQSGKTLSAFVIPTLYHLFELGETVVCGVPDLSMVADKWEIDLLPVIERTRYRRLMPRVGEGARGGRVESAVRFTNGATLRFMTGGGDDKTRAAFTARVLVVTEVDGFDRRAKSSREADQLEQLEARTRAFGDRSRVYLESTVSTEEGRIWREYSNGTKSRVAVPCPHCGVWTTPQREHLVGWQSVESELDAHDHGRLCCPECACEWTEADRATAQQGAVLVHDGQTVNKKGKVVGDPPRTLTLGFRWTAANNLLVPIAEVARDEWRAQADPNRENAELKLRQFVWVIPAEPAALDVSAVDQVTVARRSSDCPRGVVPEWCERMTSGIDLGRHLLHWTLIAWSLSGRGAVVDYGRIDVPSGDMADDRAIMLALREFRDTTEAGWQTAAGGKRSPELVLVDSGWHADVVYAFTAESGARYVPAKGLGVGQYGGKSYREPKTTGTIVTALGDRYHVAKLESGVRLLEFDADGWKSFVHDRLRAPVGEAGALDLFRADAREHTSFAAHLCSEQRIEEFIPRKGMVTRWIARSKSNHWLDSTTMASVAGHAQGVRVVVTGVQQQASRPARKRSGAKVTGGWKFRR